MEDLLLLTPDNTVDDPELRDLPDGLVRAQIIRSASPNYRTHMSLIIEGIQKLVQEVWLEIISDRTPDGTGSGMAAALQSTAATESSINRLAQQYAAIVQSNVIRNQGLVGRLPATEQLRSLLVSAVEYSATSRQASISLELQSRAGMTVSITYETPRRR